MKSPFPITSRNGKNPLIFLLLFLLFLSLFPNKIISQLRLLGLLNLTIHPK